MTTFLKCFFAGILLMGYVSCTEEAAEKPPKKTNTKYVIQQPDMNKVVVNDGEVVYQAEGKNHGMESLSFVITETKPGGGPPLHTHPTEEAHVVLSGQVTYYIADSVFTVKAPFIVRIPPNTPHTFINSGDSVLNLVGVFGQDNFGPYNPIGKSPLKKQ